MALTNMNVFASFQILLALGEVSTVKNNQQQIAQKGPERATHWLSHMGHTLVVSYGMKHRDEAFKK